MKLRGFFILLLLTIIITGCNRNNIEMFYPGQGVALINAVIVDGTGNDIIQDGVLLFKDGKIELVGSKSDVNIPKDYLKKDMKGNTVLPGFINTHVHKAYDEKQLQKWLKNGVTTVRALSNSGVSDFIEKRNIFKQDINNAYLVSSTPIISVTGGYGSIFANSKKEVNDLIIDYVQQDIDIIKFSIEDDCQGRRWNLMSQELINEIVNKAHENNKRVAVHLTWSRNLEFAIEANVDEVSHMVVDLVSSETIQQMIEKDIYWVPTLELWYNISPVYSLNARVNLREFYQAGGKIALGTDFGGYRVTFDDGFPITEVNLMKDAGMSNMDIIVAGTKNASVVCDLEEKIGTLEVGKDADILVVEGNPLDDINILTKTYLVIHKGKIILR